MHFKAEIPDIHIPSSYLEYIIFLKKNITLAKQKISNQYLKEYIPPNNLLNIIPNVVYILDYRSQEYLYINESCKDIFGFSASFIMKKGQRWLLERLHKDDLEIISQTHFKTLLIHCHNSSLEEIKNCLFSLNYRVKNNNGNYIHILQQYVILEIDEYKNPILTLGTCTNITDFKSDNTVNFSVKKCLKGIRTKEIYGSDPPNNKMLFSSRENDVLKLLFYGSSSKKIAETLNISYYTVRAHRRNLIQKSNCKNTPELICFAMKNNLF
jgi:DNA-binding CsgD family transcriptional regulator